MTNHWIDLRNSDCILMMGANPAENHPVSMRWVLAARDDRGATLISVDPRYTRTSAVADVYAPLRSGTDLAFLGGLIRHILDGDLIHRDYVIRHTNASLLIDERFRFDEAAGLFSGYDEATRSYDKSTWQYQYEQPTVGTPPEPKTDPTLEHPQCVYQILRRHYARYTIERVSQVTGTPSADLQRVYRAFAATGAADKAGTIMFAMGWTQHTTGTQTIRAMAIAQSLLGNIGRPGGGMNALRGESNVQGSTDHGLLFNILPGYLKTPTASQQTLAKHHAACTPAPTGRLDANGWADYPKYSVSLLKSMFGRSATAENDFGYVWLPKRDDGVDHSWLSIFDAMHRGSVHGLFAWGQNPACSGANAAKVRRALARLDWLVCVNLFPNETGWFWQDEKLLAELGGKPEDVPTEVFVLPAAAFVEKEGSVTNSGRWMQWRHRAADSPGDARADSQWMDLIYRELRDLYRADAEQAVCPEPILNLVWDEYFPDGQFDPHAVARQLNGRFLRDVEFPAEGKRFKQGEQVPDPAYLRSDGSTSSGNWLYCGSYIAPTPQHGNLAARRRAEPDDGPGANPDWAWCWPMNRRIIYNRKTFRMLPDGRARLFAPTLADGPLPEHYEPLESPLTHNPFCGQMFNPAAKPWDFRGVDVCSPCGSREFPYVCTTYRVTEHWQTGVITRHCPWLLELQPQLFVELSRELATEKGIRPGDRVRVRSARGSVAAIALPTARLKPFRIVVDGRSRTIHQVGLPWCFGWLTPEGGGDSANLLTPNVGDANTLIPETKAFLVDLEKVSVGGE